MQVIINGESRILNQSQTVSDMIQELQLEGKIAIEINQTIIPRSLYTETGIEKNDVIEIVNAIGGG